MKLDTINKTTLEHKLGQVLLGFIFLGSASIATFYVSRWLKLAYLLAHQ